MSITGIGTNVGTAALGGMKKVAEEVAANVQETAKKEAQKKFGGLTEVASETADTIKASYNKAAIRLSNPTSPEVIKEGIAERAVTKAKFEELIENVNAKTSGDYTTTTPMIRHNAGNPADDSFNDFIAKNPKLRDIKPLTGNVEPSALGEVTLKPAPKGMSSSIPLGEIVPKN